MKANIFKFLVVPALVLGLLGGVISHAAAAPPKPGKTELGVAAQAIGVSETDLTAAMKQGQSVAQVAQAHGVAPQTVIDALVADLTAKA